MAADVDVCAKALLLIADDDDRNACDLGRDVVTDLRELLLDTGVVPHRPEDRLLLELVESRVVVELDGERMTRIQAAADPGRVEIESCEGLCHPT